MPFKGKKDETEENPQEMAEVEEIINTDVDSLRPSQRSVLQMLHWLESSATEDTDDSGAGFFGDDIAGILMAPDETTMWDSDELPRYNAKNLSGCELELYGIAVKFSNDATINSGLIGPANRRKMFVLVRAARLNDSGQTKLYKLPDVGEEFQWNTSARFIVAKLVWLQTHGYFDDNRTVKVRIQGTKLDGEKSVEKLKPLTAPVMAGATDEPPF